MTVAEVETIRQLAVRMAQELDVHVDRAEYHIRNLITKGLIEVVPDKRHAPCSFCRKPWDYTGACGVGGCPLGND